MEPVDAIDYWTEPAPGRLELVRAFANTVDAEHGREALHSPAQLQRLLVELGLLEADVRVSSADLAAALDLRDRIRALALANNGVATDVSLDAPLVAHVNDRDATLAAPQRDVAGALAELVGIVYTATVNGTWPRLKACRRDVCQWLFYDRSRNRSGVWCSMAVCGNRTKTAAYRSRATRS
jgi:predicted RNA-binding Zn ribbon-like protein